MASRMLRRFCKAMMPLLLVALSASTALADLRAFSSRYYQIRTDLEPGFAQDLARRLDAMHEEYARRLTRFDTSRSNRPASVYLFTAKDDYLKFAGHGMRSTGGVFVPARNALAAFSDGQGRDNLRRTLQHEAFHQFAASAIRHPLPMWINEGMAQYFEEGLWTGDGFVLGEIPPRRVRQLQADIASRRLISFKELMNLTPDGWGRALASRSPTRGATQYNQSWAMVHFLVNAVDEQNHPRFRTNFIQMLELIHAGIDPEQAFTQALGGNYDNFQSRFLEWAQGLQPTPLAEYIERQEVLADMLVAMHDYGRTYTDIASFKDAVSQAKLEIQYSRGQIKWSTGKQTDRYFHRIDGEPFSRKELYLDDRRGAPLPDIVCRALPNALFRTRFHRSGEFIEHELLIEPSDSAGQPLASPFYRSFSKPRRH